MYRNIAKRDIAKGDDVNTRDELDSFYEVDGERLVQIAKYSSKTGDEAPMGKVQCYNGKNAITGDDVTVYYTARGNMFVKTSNHAAKAINTTTGTPVNRDILAQAKK